LRMQALQFSEAPATVRASSWEDERDDLRAFSWHSKGPGPEPSHKPRPYHTFCSSLEWDGTLPRQARNSPLTTNNTYRESIPASTGSSTTRTSFCSSTSARSQPRAPAWKVHRRNPRFCSHLCAPSISNLFLCGSGFGVLARARAARGLWRSAPPRCARQPPTCGRQSAGARRRCGD
jgi:hypothetical protein